MINGWAILHNQCVLSATITCKGVPSCTVNPFSGGVTPTELCNQLTTGRLGLPLSILMMAYECINSDAGVVPPCLIQNTSGQNLIMTGQN